APGLTVENAEITNTGLTASMPGQSPDNIATSPEEAVFVVGHKYFWYGTLVYDGFQESLPVLLLSQPVVMTGWKKLLLRISVDSSLSKRVTGVCIYRAEAP